ncbi:hypothetical protein [Streptomyces sp. CAU 1734]|uniref:hypothetical protein n=1 Tax=Streptomyces sp. CAU 1734 TaxID=3140360 RepID=UPI00326000D4
MFIAHRSHTDPDHGWSIAHAVHGYLAHIEREGGMYAAVRLTKEQALTYTRRLNTESTGLKGYVSDLQNTEEGGEEVNTHP